MTNSRGLTDIAFLIDLSHLFPYGDTEFYGVYIIPVLQWIIHLYVELLTFIIVMSHVISRQNIDYTWGNV